MAAQITCSCGQVLACPDGFEGQEMRCPKCGATVLFPQPGLTEEKFCAWETNRPFFERLIETWKLIMLQPADFFRKMPVGGGMTRPLVYGVILGSFAVIMGQIWSLCGELFLAGMLRTMERREGLEFLGSPISIAFSLALIVLSPLLTVIVLFIGAAILHVCLMLVGGAKRGFEATMRVYCYTTSPLVLGAVPVIGSLVGTVWSLVLDIIGLAEAHGITRWRAAIAVLLPIVLCCGGGLLAFGGIIVAVLTAGH